jgi:hypothetical protein
MARVSRDGQFFDQDADGRPDGAALGAPPPAGPGPAPSPSGRPAQEAPGRPAQEAPGPAPSGRERLGSHRRDPISAAPPSGRRPLNSRPPLDANGPGPGALLDPVPRPTPAPPPGRPTHLAGSPPAGSTRRRPSLSPSPSPSGRSAAQRHGAHAASRPRPTPPGRSPAGRAARPGRAGPAVLGRSTAVLAAGTFLSRLSGFARVSVAAFVRRQ